MSGALPSLSIPQRTIWVYRLLSFFVALLAVTLPYIIPPEDNVDPLWQRFALGGILLVYPIASFLSHWVRKNTYYFLDLSSHLACAWLLELMFLNNFSLDYSPTYFIGLCLASFMFRSFRALVIFFAVQLVLAGALFAVPPDPLVSPVYIYMLQVLLMIGLSFLLYRQITERKNLLSKASRLEEIAVAAFEYSGDGILVTDDQGKVLQSNPRFLEIWGLKKEDIQGGERKVVFEKVKHNILDLELWEAIYQDAYQNPEKYVFQALTLKDGRHLERFSRPISLGISRKGRIWFYKDVTDSKKKTEALNAQKEFLESANQALVGFSTSEVVQQGKRDAALEEIVQVAAHILNAEGAIAWWQNAADGTFEPISQFGACAGDDPDLCPATITVTDFLSSLEGQLVLETNGAKQGPKLDGILKSLPGLEERTSLQVPVRVDGKIKGLISLISGPDRSFNADERGFAGSVGNVITAILEAGQRRIAEEELANNLAILTSVFEMSGLGIVVTTIGGRVLDYNADFVNMWELSPAMLEPGGEKALDAQMQSSYLHQGDADDTMALKFEHPAQSRFDVLHLVDGRIIERTTRGLWVNGDIQGRIWYYQDVTQRVRSRDALRRSETRNRALISAIPDLLLRLQPDGVIIDQRVPEDTIFPEIFLRKPTSLSQVFPEELCEQMLVAMVEVGESKQLKEIDFQIEQDDSILDLEIRMLQSGEEEILAIIRDVSIRKTTERELIQRNFELDSFVYRASHDLKAPLNSLMGIIDILVNEELPGEVRSYIRLMDRSVVKLDTFIRNLTDFSRIARLEIQDQKVDFRELYGEVLESLKYMEHADKVEKQVMIEGGFPLHGDRFHVGIVLSNLLSNAIKYQDHAKETSRVDVTLRLGPETVELEISDNGIGIPEEYQERLFELFFRASNQSFGSGLGLYITKNAVEKMDGQIQLVSEAGVGTTFTIAFPNHFKGELKSESTLA